jgi:diguanylate cyclase
MLWDLPQSDLDLPSGKRRDELIGGVRIRTAGGNGQTRPGGAQATAHQPRIDMSARAEELQQLLGASIDENSQLATQVRRLEAELRRRSMELAKLRTELRGAVQDALTDPLTGLANRRSFDLALRAVAAHRSSPAHLVMADIDHFKRVNDTHGHDIGDEILRIVGEILLAQVRRDSVVARVGGDEFGLLLPGAGSHYAASIATRLCDLLANRPLVVRGFPELSERVTLSIGVAAWHADESSAEWYARADAALYEAKRRGRSRVALDPQLAHGSPVRQLPSEAAS